MTQEFDPTREGGNHLGAEAIDGTLDDPRVTVAGDIADVIGLFDRVEDAGGVRPEGLAASKRYVDRELIVRAYNTGGDTRTEAVEFRRPGSVLRLLRDLTKSVVDDPHFKDVA